LDKKHQIGTYNEFRAGAYLTSLGYHIFTSITSSTSPIDIIAVHPKTQDYLFVDVKTVSIRKSGKAKGKKINRCLTPLQKKLGVRILNCYEDGSFKWEKERKKNG